MIKQPADSKKELMLPDEVIMDKIYMIRGQKVMLDHDLAALYEVETRRLNEQVKRNPERFPEDFMFQLTHDEIENLKSQFATSRWGGRRKLPNAFTEHGVLMLSSVLNSKRAILVNLQIMRIYTRLRTLLLSNKDVLARLESIERNLSDHDQKILLIFEYIRQLEQTKQQDSSQQTRERIGYKSQHESKTGK